MVSSIAVKDANQSTQTVATIDALVALVGEVQGSPTSNTVLERLKAIKTSVDALHTDLTGTLSVSLPSGASTAANQTTANTSLGNIDTNAGTASDAAATAGSTGTISAKLRAISRDLVANIVLASGSNLIGKVAAGDTTDAIYNGTTALTPKYAKIAASSSGNNTLVAAVTSKKIRVLAYNFMGAGAVNAKFQDGAGGTDLTGLKYIDAAGGGIAASYNPVGWFETTANTLLNLNLSGAVAVGGELVYVEV